MSRGLMAPAATLKTGTPSSYRRVRGPLKVKTREGKSLTAQSAPDTCGTTAALVYGLGLISPCFIADELHAVVCLYNQGEAAELLAKVPKIS